MSRSGMPKTSGWLAVAALVVVNSVLLHAQPQPKLLEFEVASVKPLDPDKRMHGGDVRTYPGGRVVIPSATLKALVVSAFNLSWFQLSGAEPWMEKEEYDVEAKPSSALQPPITNLRHSHDVVADERLREMLQTLLIDRFHLKFHREKKPGKVYLLERTGKPLRLIPADSETSDGRDLNGFSGDIGFGGGRWVLSNTSMPQLAKFGEIYVLRAPVVDKTGLSGYFGYKQLTRLPDSEVDYSNPPFIPLLSEVGLKLTPTQGEIETFVIDHAERPSEN